MVPAPLDLEAGSKRLKNNQRPPSSMKLATIVFMFNLAQQIFLKKKDSFNKIEHYFL